MDKEVNKRLVRVLDIVVPVISIGAFLIFLIENTDGVSEDFSDYALYVFAPHLWWILRYILTGRLFPGRQKTAQPIGDRSAEEIATLNEDLATPGAKNPSVWRYIGVWLLASILTSIIGTLMGALFANEMRYVSNPASLYLFVIPTIAIGVSLAVWIGVYKVAKSLRISRVMPYIYLSVVLGFSLDVASTLSGLPGYLSDAQMTGYLVYTLLLYTGFALGFRAAFRNTAQWGER